LLLSDDAFRLLTQFGAGERAKLSNKSNEQAVQEQILHRLIEPGMLLSTRYALQGKKIRLALEEIMQLRDTINIDDLGLLELECLILYLLARENKFKEPICELGSMFGGSTIALALGALKCKNKNRVLAVDDHEWHQHIAAGSFPPELARTIPTSLPRFKKNLKKAKLSRQVKVLIQDTVRAANEYKGKTSMLFIDANHSYDGIVGDFQAWFPKLVKGGIVAFHDYGNRNWPDVKPAVDVLRHNFSTFTCYQTLAVATKA
jgi:predicted O-methyltransferase YrrM